MTTEDFASFFNFSMQIKSEIDRRDIEIIALKTELVKLKDELGKR
jgi:hypothetical protein